MFSALQTCSGRLFYALREATLSNFRRVLGLAA